MRKIASFSGAHTHAHPTMEIDAPVRLRSAPSIPSRFETVLHLGGREQDGFGNRVTRFAYRSDDKPGPGAYGSVSSSVARATTSHSKKGYGPIASKRSRFDRAPFQRAPAPGTYDAKLPGKPKLSTTSTRGMAAFVKNTTRIAEKKEEPMPGPGAYDPSVQVAIEYEPPRTAKPAFGLGQPRFNRRAPWSAPAPGTYNIAKESSLLQSTSVAAPAFKSKVSRGSSQFPSAPTQPNVVDQLRPARQLASVAGE